jgi:cell division protein FtsI/penicillin-binding protein 2
MRARKRKFDRLAWLALAFFVLGVILVLRLFNLQVLQSHFYRSVAENIRNFQRELEARRGQIFVWAKSNGSSALVSGLSFSKLREEYLDSLTISIDSRLLYAIPSRIENPEEVAAKLAPFLDIPPHQDIGGGGIETVEDEESEETSEFQELVAKLSKKNDFYEVLRHELTDYQFQEIQSLNLSGISFEPEIYRFYPEGELFAHVLGFIGYKEDKRVGQYGIEEYFQDLLAGQNGLVKGEVDPGGRVIIDSQELLKESEDGQHLILTLDKTIQFMAQKELEKGLREFEAKSGSIIIMEPQSGRIMAMVSLPSFDPNDYGGAEDMQVFLNPVVSETYEPGSIFKAITFAAALDTGKIGPDTQYKDEGFVKIEGYTIRNSDNEKHDIQTMTEVLEKSLNTGAVFAVKKTGVEVFASYVRDFGFGALTSIELPGEARGDISNLAKASLIYAATASYGHGISVTPLQLIAAFGAIANQGKLVKPYLVEAVVTSDGDMEITHPKEIRQVISRQTANTLGAMMVSVVENGFGRRAGVEGYYVAGKTGTAEIPRKDAPGYSEETIHSFIGFAPVENPRFVILVKLDSPESYQFASYTAASVFGRMVKFLLNYYGVPPTNN